MTLKLYKPIYGMCFGIRDKYLNNAIRAKTKLRVEYKGENYNIDPKEWIKTGERVEQVFLIPDQPMILYRNHLSRFPKQETPITSFNAMTALAGTDKWEALRAKLHN